MVIKKLYHDLLEAYSTENLNKISGKLIVLYKSKNFASIRQIANKIAKYVDVDDEKDARCFSKLIMLYHPDKGESVKQQINLLYEKNDLEQLQKFAHIFSMSDIDMLKVETVEYSADYEPEYEWDADYGEGFNYTGNEDDDEQLEYDDDISQSERTFFNLLKIREYGTTNVHLPTYYLEDFEDFEMEGSGLESLEGVEYCTHVKILDVSNNKLSDISELWGLKDLEELYLANNQIGYIDVLSNLTKLKILDVSGNQIDDISPLFDLCNLEYVNIVGNPVSKEQQEMLEKNGCIVCNSAR
ncbi:MAG: leucine-rich repeat domain-containing protein [Prolixibacteraceae bacterium]|nr:leucine-rich repeat domain-containing protein [Prolixibacteraceae bacterium]MBN2650394.1 leucine-rich repeat domain-containing protein [Prolixibacteraceae bacterium]